MEKKFEIRVLPMKIGMLFWVVALTGWLYSWHAKRVGFEELTARMSLQAASEKKWLDDNSEWGIMGGMRVQMFTGPVTRIQ